MKEKKLCHSCLEYDVIIDENLCGKCFGKKFKMRRTNPFNTDIEEATFEDLKKKWEERNQWTKK